MAKQNQKRFLLSKRPDLAECADPVRLIQGYFETKANRSARVRLIDNGTAELTVKTGRGVQRESDTRPMPLDLARHMLDTVCNSSIVKYRYRKDGWVVDIFNDALTGLIIAEVPLPHPNAPVTLPEWADNAQEITNSLTNHELARLAGRIATAGATLKNPKSLLDRPRRIVITGAPCSGKSTAIKAVKRELGRRVHCVPEVATVLISLVGYRPTEERISAESFQRSVYALQKSFEQAADEQCRSDGKDAVVTDRGGLDGGAYLDDGLIQLERVCGINAVHEAMDYDAVLFLEPTRLEVYERMRTNNPARTESYRAAIETGHRLREAWSLHPCLIPIPDFPTWEEKEASILDAIRRLLDE